MADVLGYLGKPVLVEVGGGHGSCDRLRKRMQDLGIGCRMAAHDPLRDNSRASRHASVLSEAVEEGAERIMIIEGEVIVRDDFGDLLQLIQPQLESVAWDIFYLGLPLIRCDGLVTPNLGRVSLGFDLRAYAIARKALPTVLGLLRRLDAGIPLGSSPSLLSHLLSIYAIPLLAAPEPGAPSHEGTRDHGWGSYFRMFSENEFRASCSDSRLKPSSALSESEKADWEISDFETAYWSARKSHDKGRLAEADRYYDIALKLNPTHPEALLYKGILSRTMGNHATAIETLYQALQQKSDGPDRHCALAQALLDIGRNAEALELTREALGLWKADTGLIACRARALIEMGRTGEAIDACVEGMDTTDDAKGELRRILACIYLAEDAPEKGLSHAIEAAARDSKSVEAQQALGLLHLGCDNVPEALVALRAARRLAPNNAEISCNIGAALQRMGDVANAKVCLQRALELNPMSALAHYNLALSLLAEGDSERGWAEYEWRRELPEDKAAYNRVWRCPEWNGGSLEGRTILVECEQGLGDTIQFVRYVLLLIERARKVIVECQPSLATVIRSLSPEIVVASFGDCLPAFDVHVRMASLPSILGQAPSKQPYLFADHSRVTHWKQHLDPGYRVGIVWKGSDGYRGDRFRSIPLSEFEPLARVPGIRLYSLQQGRGVEQLSEVPFAITRLYEPVDIADGFVDTAAIMKNLNLVVTSDTSSAHLAGALGVPVWVALSTAPDWRWMTDRSDSPWYASMTLFRQRRFADWGDVFRRMAAALMEGGAPTGPGEGRRIAMPCSAAQILDRITILRLKCRNIHPGPLKAQLLEELEELSALWAKLATSSERLSMLETDLQQINEVLWQTEDELRRCEAGGNFGERFIALARRVYISNDRRGAIKEEVDRLLQSKFTDPKIFSGQAEFYREVGNLRTQGQLCP